MVWPDLFGPGWIWGVLAALGFLTLFVALVLVLGDTRVPDRAVKEVLQHIWRRHE